MTYSENKHRHNFAVWAAARAAQRGFTNVEMLKEALEQCGIENFVSSPSEVTDFDNKHKAWCKSICDYLEEKGVQNVTYGRAAKLVNVYLKSMVVLQNLAGEAAKIIHPPIDRILLQNIAKSLDISKENKKILKSANWTQVSEEEYFNIIQILKTTNKDRPFWMIEEYWTVTNE